MSNTPLTKKQSILHSLFLESDVVMRDDMITKPRFWPSDHAATLGMFVAIKGALLNYQQSWDSFDDLRSDYGRVLTSICERMIDDRLTNPINELLRFKWHDGVGEHEAYGVREKDGTVDDPQVIYRLIDGRQLVGVRSPKHNNLLLVENET